MGGFFKLGSWMNKCGRKGIEEQEEFIHEEELWRCSRPPNNTSRHIRGESGEMPRSLLLTGMISRTG